MLGPKPVNAVVPLNRISYKYLSTIPYKIYILTNKDKDAMDAWFEAISKVCRPKSRKNYTYNYSIKIYNAIKNEKAVNTKFCWENIINKGQVLKRVRFSYDDKTGIYYPNSGATRVASAYVLGHSFIPAKVAFTTNGVRWKRNRGVTSKYFRYVTGEVIDKLLIREKVNELFIDGVISNNIARPEFLFSIPNLGIRGELEVEDVLFNIIKMIKDKVVLNLIPDNGFLETKISKYCKFIYTVSDFECNNKISCIINKYYKVDNTCFGKDIPSTYDIALCKRGEDYCSDRIDKDKTIFI